MKLSVSGRFAYDLLDSSTNQSLCEYMNIKHVIIHNNINSMPNIQVGLETTSRIDYYSKLTDAVIKLSSKDEFEISYPFGISKVVSVSNRFIELKGYMCKRLDFMELGSEYLGESLDEAVSALEFRDTVNNVDAISGDYWRINETKMECLLRLLSGAKSKSIFNITESEINIIQLDGTNSVQNDYFPPSEAYDLVTCDRFSDTNYSLYESEDEETANKAVPMFNAMWNSLSIVGYEHKDFVANFMSSMTYRYPIKRVLKFRYNNTYVPYSVGESMKINVDTYGYSSMLILSKNLMYDIGNGKLITELVLGTLG